MVLIFQQEDLAEAIPIKTRISFHVLFFPVAVTTKILVSKTTRCKEIVKNDLLFKIDDKDTDKNY